MRVLVLSACLSTAATLLALSLPGCYSPLEPPCSFQCSPTGECPEDYECRADGYCHLRGSTETCPFPPVDFSAAPDDLGMGADLSGADLSGMDLAVPDLAEPPDLSVPDLTSPPDLTTLPDLFSADA